MVIYILHLGAYIVYFFISVALRIITCQPPNTDTAINFSNDPLEDDNFKNVIKALAAIQEDLLKQAEEGNCVAYDTSQGNEYSKRIENDSNNIYVVKYSGDLNYECTCIIRDNLNDFLDKNFAYSLKALCDDVKKADLTCLIKNKSQGLSIINKRHIWFNFSLDEFLNTDFTDLDSIANLVRIATERSNNSETETNND